MMSNEVIVAKDVVKVFANGVKALNGVSLHVPPGEIYCLLGPNGAGKSTLVNIFLDFIRPTSGETFVNSLSCQTTPGAAKSAMAYLPDSVELFPEMKALDTLRFFAQLNGNQTDSESLLLAFDQVLLERRWARTAVGHFSKGMRQKLGLAILLVKNANAYLMDEPLVGVDPHSCHEMVDVIMRMKALGKSFLLTTHDLLRARLIADRVGILNKGSLVAEYDRSELSGLDLESVYLQHLN